jgi:hypothetical protein
MRRNLKNELDVDFIGGQKPLTKDEELAISAFIKSAKLKRAKSKTGKIRVRRPKQNVTTT